MWVQAYLFPFCTGSKQSYHCVGNSRPTGNDGGVVDELISTEFEEEQGADEDGDIVGDGVTVGHIKVLKEKGWKGEEKKTEIVQQIQRRRVKAGKFLIDKLLEFLLVQYLV